MRIKGPARVEGSLAVPGDKSISHRIAMLASIANGTSKVSGLASSADVGATLDCIRNLGITVKDNGSELLIHGRGLFGYRAPAEVVDLDAGNSGSTIRMLSGLLAAQRFTSRIDGDASLRRRPMARIVKPLSLMGAQIEAVDGNFPPLTIRGQELRAITYASSVASAQVKTCVLLAGLLAEGRTSYSEPALSRDHTELMLKEMGASVDIESADAGALSIEGRQELTAIDYRVPGDLSSAAFFIAAATLLPGSKLIIENVNLNPTRTGFLEVLAELGAQIERQNMRVQHGEQIGDLMITSAQLVTESPGLILSGSIIPNILDEIPMLAVIATQVEGQIEVRDAKELRLKESDRIRTVADGIRALGCEIEESEDGFSISGPQRLIGARVNSAGDHRIAMAFSIAGLVAAGTTEISGADCASVSFPEFYASLAMLASPDGAVETERAR